MFRLKGTILGLSLAVTACSSDPGTTAPPSETPDDLPDSACVPGATERYPSQLDYAAGIHLTGSKGVTVTLVAADPAPPARGANTWELLIEKAGEPVEGAQVILEPWMTKHGHGTTTRIAVSDDGGGKYTAGPIVFTMANFWDTKITVRRDGESDFVNFGFCVE